MRNKNTVNILENVAYLMKSGYDLYYVGIYLIEKIGEFDYLVLVAGTGKQGKMLLSAGHSIPLERQASLQAQVARTRQPVIWNNVEQEPNYIPLDELPKTGSQMAVPVVMDDLVLAVIDIRDQQTDRFDDDFLHNALTVADQVAQAVKNTKNVADDTLPSRSTIEEKVDLGEYLSQVTTIRRRNHHDD